jgi:hypothetical protein
MFAKRLLTDIRMLQREKLQTFPTFVDGDEDEPFIPPTDLDARAREVQRLADLKRQERSETNTAMPETPKPIKGILRPTSKARPSNPFTKAMQEWDDAEQAEEAEMVVNRLEPITTARPS